MIRKAIGGSRTLCCERLSTSSRAIPSTRAPLTDMLTQHKESVVVEGHLIPDRVHMCLGIAPQPLADVLRQCRGNTQWAAAAPRVLVTLIVVLDKAPCAHIHGKGRKQRTVPLWRSTASQIRSWLLRIRASPDKMLFPNRSGNPMTRSNVTDRLKLAARTATRQCPQLSSHPISPHVIRHYIPFRIMSCSCVRTRYSGQTADAG
jgi:hypothetical protein